jgi:activating signal cointegrator complex subunit 2
MHRGVARILSRVDEEARSATRTLANDMQWEYDDEYDDSFDDLNRSGRGGIAERETERQR